jgi:hypothetical protein
MRSDSVAALASALSKAQGMIRGASKDGSNPMFKSKYSTLDSVWKACREALAANELSIVQETEIVDGSVYMVTTLMHSSGEWRDSRLPFTPPTNQKGTTDIQAAGSYITYLRRYMLAAMVGVAPTDDDDGEGAMQRDYVPSEDETMAARFRDEINATMEVPHLEAWGRNASSDIASLPKDWADRVRGVYKARMSELKRQARAVAES